MEQRMKQYRSHSMRLVFGACGFLLTMAGGQAGFGQQAAKVPARADAGLSKALSAYAPGPPSALAQGVERRPPRWPNVSGRRKETAKPDKPGQQGIKVHGHWVIDLKNPDGTLVRHLDFENSLVSSGFAISGSQLLALLISGNVTPSDPAIGFVPTAQYTSATDATTMCPNLLAEQCALLTTSESFYSTVSTGTFLPSAFNAQTGLHAVVTVGPSVNWVLSGNFTVPSGLTSISAVQTLLSVCLPSSSNVLQNYAVTAQLTGSYSDRNADISSSACKVGLASTPSEAELYFPLTSTTVPNAPLLVTPQQIVTVTVTISFS